MNKLPAYNPDPNFALDAYKATEIAEQLNATSLAQALVNASGRPRSEYGGFGGYNY